MGFAIHLELFSTAWGSLGIGVLHSIVSKLVTLEDS